MGPTDRARGDESRWGHADGLQLGLQPEFGPRGLLRIFAPYLGHPAERLVNFIAIEPIVAGQTERGFSELEMSALDGVRGKRFWSTDEFDPAGDRGRDGTAAGRRRDRIRSAASSGSRSTCTPRCSTTGPA